MRATIALAMLLALPVLARADDPPKAPVAPAAPALTAKPATPRTPEQAADAVLAAVKAQDDAALKALASKDDPDPWLVADEVIRRGESAAADRFAKAAPRVDINELPAYVASRRGRALDGAARAALQTGNLALAKGAFDRAIELLDLPLLIGDSIVEIRVAHARGFALRGVKRLAESSKLFLESGRRAKAIGWMLRADTALHEAGLSAYMHSDWAGARAAWHEQLTMAEGRGNRERVAWALVNIGLMHSYLGDSRRALEVEEQALELMKALGNRSGLATALGNVGLIQSSFANHQKALAAHELALKSMQEVGDRAGVARTLGNIGLVHVALGDHTRALEFLDRALKLSNELGDRPGMARALGASGDVYFSLGDYPRALEVQERALKVMETIGDRPGQARRLASIGAVHCSLGNYPKALEVQERALKLSEDVGDRMGVATALGYVGTVHRYLASYPKALECLGRSLKMMEELGSLAGAAVMLSRIGVVEDAMGRYPEALTSHERSRRLMDQLKDRKGVATALSNIGNVHFKLGDYRTALAEYEEALGVMIDIGDRAGAASTVGNIGNVQMMLGNYSGALNGYERALKLKGDVGDRAGAATTLGNIGLVHYSLGDFTKALEVQERALKIKEQLGNSGEIALTLGNIGSIYTSLGNYSKALELAQRVLRMSEENEDPAGVVRALSGIGGVHRLLGDYPKAIEYRERVLKLQEDLGDRSGVALTLGNLGNVYQTLGNYPKALEFHERALAMKEELGDRAEVAKTLGAIGLAYGSLGDYGKALRFEHRAALAISMIARGLGADEGVGVRGLLSTVYDVGVQATVALNDVTELAFFLESGRSGALIEGLKAREALWAATVSPELRAEEARARVAETAAANAIRRLPDTGDRAEMRARRADLAAAQEQVATVIARIQREAKSASALVYPVPATLDELRSTLGDGDALILYGLIGSSEDEHVAEGAEPKACALVVTPGGGRMVALASSRVIEAAANALTLDDTTVDATERIAALGRLVVEPLRLPLMTKRVLVSPIGALSKIPFSLLLPGATVVYAASGTTYGMLLADGGLRGQGVLALGDPDYATEVDDQAVAVNRGALGRLSRLPASREEAKAVGTFTLLGSEATEAGLTSALGKQPRWRAVHFACHGLVNTERPALSSLAITAAGDDDGFLSCLDVFRMKIPADLVVLSACETGKGKVVKSEGIVGFTRAFMFAGAPRVICSLWRVDDDATKALMVKFYELWNPKDGKPGIPTAEALKEAQEFVRSHEEWKHPYYWAAWVLWGLPS